MAEKKSQKNTPVKQIDPEQKEKALAAALAQIEKQFGKGSIMKLGDTQALDIEAVSTGFSWFRLSIRHWWFTNGSYCGNLWTGVFR